ncbi:MAG: hypothetical protein E7003_06855 [Eggerthellaceae bacterium]|nr:hypothetical protein [Eggerthellaceae bacterium]
MSQCYEWTNFDKRERLDNVWQCGLKLWESDFTGCGQNNAVLTLLSGRWSGDRLVWFGCEGLGYIKNDTPFKDLLLSIDFEEEYYTYADITGLFPDAAGKLGVDWSGDDGGRDVLYTGPFDTEVQWLRYVVNLDKKQFIDRERTAVHLVVPGEVWRDDLFPVLSVPFDWDPKTSYLGMWFGDRLTATNVRPPEEYEDLSYLKSERSVTTGLSNEEILAYVSEGAPEVTEDPSTPYRDTAWYKYANKRLDELIGLDFSGVIVS